MKIEEMIDRLLKERLEPFSVPAEIRNNIAIELMAILSRSTAMPQGSYVYRPEQSMQGDLQRKNKPKS